MPQPTGPRGITLVGTAYPLGRAQQNETFIKIGASFPAEPLQRPVLPLLKLPSPAQDESWDRYLSACHDYLRRQILVYQNWPQRKWTPLGLSQEKVFNDLNA